MIVRRVDPEFTPVDVSEILARLDPLERDAVHAVYFLDRSVTAAARLLDVDRVAVQSALAAAFRRIARSLGEDPPDG